eukprot:1944990-Amphidinium_carterae.1
MPLKCNATQMHSNAMPLKCTATQMQCHSCNATLAMPLFPKLSMALQSGLKCCAANADPAYTNPNHSTQPGQEE